MEQARAGGRLGTVVPGATERLARPAERGLWRALLDLMLPPHCVGCRGAGAWLCEACDRSLAWIGDGGCLRCGARLAPSGRCRFCREEPLRLAGLRAAVPHRGVGRELVRGLKYRGQRALAPIMAVGLEAVWRRPPALTGHLVPVPLHPDRERRRGFNQSRLLAHALAERCDPPLMLADGLLRRTRPTPPQVGLSRPERRANVAAAFACPAGAFAGETVILIDDVATTGATLDACAEAVRAAGAARVYGLVFSRAGMAGDPHAGG